MLAAICTAAADYSDLKLWKGAKGLAPKDPEVKAVETKVGKGAIYYLWDAHFFTGRLAKENFPIMDKLFSNLLKMRK